MMTTHPDIINRDLLAFIEGQLASESNVSMTPEPAAA
jgi:hypothetical protein